MAIKVNKILLKKIADREYIETDEEYYEIFKHSLALEKRRKEVTGTGEETIIKREIDNILPMLDSYEFFKGNESKITLKDFEY